MFECTFSFICANHEWYQSQHVNLKQQKFITYNATNNKGEHFVRYYCLKRHTLDSKLVYKYRSDSQNQAICVLSAVLEITQSIHCNLSEKERKSMPIDIAQPMTNEHFWFITNLIKQLFDWSSSDAITTMSVLISYSIESERITSTLYVVYDSPLRTGRSKW